LKPCPQLLIHGHIEKAQRRVWAGRKAP